MKITEKANKQTSTSIPMKFLKHITQQVNSMTTAMTKFLDDRFVHRVLLNSRPFLLKLFAV